jgi:hypothetical protein
MAQEMPSQNRPATPQQAPDPATNYERAKPQKEAGMGRLDSPIGGATPEDRSEKARRPDDQSRDVNNWDKSASNMQPGDRQLNAHDDPGGTGGGGNPMNQINLAPEQPDHSMFDEEPTDADLSPQDIHDPQQRRHPRTGGKGGTPDATDRNTRG